MTLRCEEIRHVRRGDDLWQAWEALLPQVSPDLQVFGPTWHAAWTETVGREGRWTGELSVVAVRDEHQRLVGLMPLARYRVGPVTVLASAGDWQPFRAILAARGFEASVGEALATYFSRERRSILRLGPYRAASLTARAFLTFAGDAGAFTHLRDSRPLALARLPGTWQEYREQVLGKEMFRKVEGYERRARKTGDVEIVHTHHPDQDQTRRLLDDVAAVEGRSWLASGGQLRFVPPVHRELWVRAIDGGLAARGQFDCWTMRLDDRPIAFCFTVTSGPVRYALACNYDEEFKALRAGFVLFRYMIEDAIARGLSTVDFGDGGIHYKRFWGAAYEDTLDVSLVVTQRVSAAAFRLARVIAEGYNAWRPSPAPVASPEPAGQGGD